MHFHYISLLSEVVNLLLSLIDPESTDHSSPPNNPDSAPIVLLDRVITFSTTHFVFMILKIVSETTLMQLESRAGLAHDRAS
jgi:hypothetical protein